MFQKRLSNIREQIERASKRLENTSEQLEAARTPLEKKQFEKMRSQVDYIQTSSKEIILNKVVYSEFGEEPEHQEQLQVKKLQLFNSGLLIETKQESIFIEVKPLEDRGRRKNILIEIGTTQANIEALNEKSLYTVRASIEKNKIDYSMITTSRESLTPEERKQLRGEKGDI